jgi:Ser/Thr protein kinase RdoA (MazF antagonist)
MSAAALVRHGDAMVFVKRHHVSVRTPEQLAAEHDFATHLRAGGLPVPAVVRQADGQGVQGTQSVLRRGGFCYEAHHVAGGLDLYRDAVSWSPYASLGHAYAAGAALARLHAAAADFGRPARPAAVLWNSCQVITAPDPLAAAGALVAARPALARLPGRTRLAGGLRRGPGPADRSRRAAASRAAPAVGARRLAPVQPHLDSGRARRAGGRDLRLRAGQQDLPVHDLALALERAVVSWLDLPETGTASRRPRRRRVLLDGYQTVRPLTGAEDDAAAARRAPVPLQVTTSPAARRRGEAARTRHQRSLVPAAGPSDVRDRRLRPAGAAPRFLSDYCASGR